MTSSGGEPKWQEGAGGLLLLAAAHETSLLSQLEEVLPIKPPNSSEPQPSPHRLLHPKRSLLLTFLFLPAVGLHRFWDLRNYTGGELDVLTGRPHPYSYHHTERFLLQLSAIQADQALTEALARWTAVVWQVEKMISCRRWKRKKLKAEVDAQLESLWQRVYRVQEKSHRESSKHEHYCRKPRDLLRALEDLAARERVMHELDNRKDQILTICKVALVNLIMWVRDRFSPSTYAHATWQCLQPFFRLPGRVQWGREVVRVELRPFNNRQLNRDLLAICQRVNEFQPRLLDGRLLILQATSLPSG